MKIQDGLLLIFAKNPVKGNVKTRLAEDLGAERALNIYLELMRYTCKITRKVKVDREIWYSKTIPGDSLFPHTSFTPYVQRGKNLGDRMENAFRQAFNNGYKKVVVIGTDCAYLTPDHIVSAFNKLEEDQVVIGPSADGGYYLLGMTRLFDSLFRDMPWSTTTVYQKTVNEIINLGIRWDTLEELNDVDRLGDWEEVQEYFPGGKQSESS